MKVALISLYHFESFAVRLLLSVLKEEGHEVFAVFLKDLRTNRINKPTTEEIDLLINLLKEKDSELAALSVRSPFRPVAIELTETIRKHLDIPVAWGGTDATLCPEEAIKYADAVCIGDGEKLISPLIEIFENGDSLRKIPGLWLKSGKKIIKSAPETPLPNLDSLPFPALLSEDKYFIEEGAWQEDPLNYNTRYDIMASRGCPFNCTYCCNLALTSVYKQNGRRVRKRSVENVLSEIEQAKEVMPHIRRIFFVDEIFGLDRSWAEEFAEKYRERIGLPFIAEIHPATVRKDTIKLLAAAGLEGVSVGIEAGDERIRSTYLKRAVTDARLLKSAQILADAGVRCAYDLILDMPFVGETELKQTFKLFCQLPRPYDLNLFSLVHFPKTQLTERLLKEDVITPDQVEGTSNKTWEQWRATLNYHPDPGQHFYNSLIALLSKRFIPKQVIIAFSKSNWLRHHPRPLLLLVQLANILKSAGRGFSMVLKGQLNFKTFKRYIRNLTQR